MGCKLSKVISARDNKTPYVDNKNENSFDTGLNKECVKNNEELSSPPALSNQQKTLIANTWQLLVENVSKVGVITFMSLFETHPDVQNVFMSFRGMDSEELKHSKELRAHALRVMGFVQKVVARINEPEKCEQLLCDLGRKHVNYGAKAEYIEFVGPQFIYAIKPSLEAEWSDDIENAWNQLFIYMAFHMKIGMRSAIASLKESLIETVSSSAPQIVDKKHETKTLQ